MIELPEREPEGESVLFDEVDGGGGVEVGLEVADVVVPLPGVHHSEEDAGGAGGDDDGLGFAGRPFAVADEEDLLELGTDRGVVARFGGSEVEACGGGGGVGR